MLSMPGIAIDWKHYSCELLDVNPSFDRNDGEIELGHRQSESIKHSWLPFLRESLLLEHWRKVIYSSSKDGQHGRRTDDELA